MESAIGVGVASSAGTCGSRGCPRAGCRDRRCSWNCTSAADAGLSDILSVDIDGEVLQSVGVVGSISGVVDGQGHAVSIRVSVVFDDAGAEAGNVV